MASKLTPTFLWQVALGVLALVCVAAASLIWISGASETHSAVEEGRRLMIRLDTGMVEGNQISLENQEQPPAVSPEEKKPGESAPASPEPSPQAASESSPESSPESPAESPAASPVESSPASPSTSPESSPESPASSPAESSSTTETAPLESVAVVESPKEESTLSLAAVPATPIAALEDKLSEKTENGILPVVAPDGVKPWRHYAKKYDRKGHLPMIAILITGLGQNKQVTEAALQLPVDMTLSFTPYARELDRWTTSARGAGHEIMLDLPLEPSNFPASDPGPYGLMTTKRIEENVKRLEWLMGRTQGYTGFITPQNEVFSGQTDSFKAVIDALGKRGLMLIVGQEPAKSETVDLLSATTTPNLIADALIDEELSPASIQARLATLEKLATKRGFAIGIAQPYPITMQQLAEWSSQLDKRGYVLVPVTFIAKIKFHS